MDDRTDSLARRARRHRRKGEWRKAANTYGELTSAEPECPRWWVLLGTMSLRAHRDETAHKAFRQALWLLRRGRHGERKVQSLNGWMQREGCDAALAA